AVGDADATFDAADATGPADESGEFGALSTPERRVLVVFSLVVAGWLTRPFLVDPYVAGVTDGAIAVAGATLLFLVPNGVEEGALLSWDDATRTPVGGAPRLRRRVRHRRRLPDDGARRVGRRVARRRGGSRSGPHAPRRRHPRRLPHRSHLEQRDRVAVRPAGRRRRSVVRRRTPSSSPPSSPSPPPSRSCSPSPRRRTPSSSVPATSRCPRWPAPASC
ncbi:hypothetical protein GJ632_18055, partial [Halogeometricum sp. CBA1124]|nr:hypothetical protein [Halogeometricum sp. CBA1124]